MEVAIHPRVLEAQEALRSIDWFSKLGHDLGPSGLYTDVVHEKSRRMALTRFCDKSDHAEAFRTESKNVVNDTLVPIMSELGIKGPQMNRFTASLKPFANELVANAVARLGLDEGMAADAHATLRWCVLHYLKVQQFLDLRGIDPLYVRIMDIFRDGHLVCGWNGNYPIGRLVVH